MSEITLKEGDFGADVTITVGSEALYLPDPERPGLTLPVPLADVAEMDSINDDGLRPVKEALKLGAMGLFTGPRGLAAGFSSATKVKDVDFNVVLKDGRRFVAVADARTYAELHSAQIAARASMRVWEFDDDTPSLADDVIARHIDAAEPPPAQVEPASVESPPASAVERRMGERRELPSFGRRRPPQ